MQLRGQAVTQSQKHKHFTEENTCIITLIRWQLVIVGTNAMAALMLGKKLYYQHFGTLLGILSIVNYFV